MTYREIFREIYSNHKTLIRLYIFFAAFVSTLFALNGNVVMAAVVIASSATVSTLSSLGGTFGAAISTIEGTKLASLDVPIAMSIVCIISIIVQYAPESFFETIHMQFATMYSFGLLEFWPVRIFFFIWCIISIITSCGTVSYSVGTTLSQIDKFLGGFVSIVVAISQIFTNVPETITVNAAEIGGTHAANLSASAGVMILTGVICFFVIIYCGINYIFVSMLCSYIDILLVPFCSMIPGLSIAIIILKVLAIIVACILAFVLPPLFIALYLIVFILAIVFFKKEYCAVRYYRNVYTKPMFKRIGGYRKNMPLYAEKLPKYLVEKEGLKNSDVAIPVYLLEDFGEEGKRHDKWYFIVNENGPYICKPFRSKNKPNIRYGLTTSADRRFFIKKSFRYFEVFNNTNGDADMGKAFRKIPKDIHFAFSKEYTHRIDDLRSITGYTDYNDYKKFWKADTVSRDLQRQDRMERAQEKYEKFFGHIFSR